MKNIKFALTLVLALAMLICLCACSDSTSTSSTDNSKEDASSNAASEVSTVSKEESTENSQPETAKFTVKVVDADGNAIKGAAIQICKDTCVFAETDDNGIAGFDAEITDGYKLSVLSCPAGYVYNGEAEVYLESGITEYTVTLAVAEE